MKKTGVFQFVTGVLVGTVMFGGSAAFAAGIMAQPKTAEVVIDGQAVDLNGYVIGGSHYFQLRDLSAALIPGGKDFSVVWDGQGNRVVIDTGRGYDPDERYVPPSASPSAAGEPSMTVEEMKAEIIRLTNMERVKAGVPELEPLPGLMDCAQAKVQDFFDNKYYGHVSPVYGTPGEMIRQYVPGATACAENLAPWRKSPQEVIDGVLDSPEHLKNMLNPKYTHIGIGIAEGADGGYWFVQHFAGLGT